MKHLLSEFICKDKDKFFNYGHFCVEENKKHCYFCHTTQEEEVVKKIAQPLMLLYSKKPFMYGFYYMTFVSKLDSGPLHMLHFEFNTEIMLSSNTNYTLMCILFKYIIYCNIYSRLEFFIKDPILKIVQLWLKYMC